MWGTWARTILIYQFAPFVLIDNIKHINSVHWNLQERSAYVLGEN